MPADNELDPLESWLKRQVAPLPPPPGTFELITKRARRRKIRKAVVTLASAAAVAAAVGVVVPLSTSLHLTTPPTNAVAAGSDATPSTAAGSHSTLGTGTATPSQSAGSSTTPSSAATPSSASTTSPAGTNSSSPAYLPPSYIPTSVTWDSTTTGWIIGQAGTPGQCANKNPDICTSVARTDDGGQHWQGVPAPDTGSGVTGLRFLNASYGWAFGPQLWATTDGGQHWHQVNTGNSSVSQLETVNGRAYAVFANCTSATGVPCRNAYTLMTAVAGSDNWTPVAGIPGNLTEAARPDRPHGHSTHWDDGLPGRAGQHAVRRSRRRDGVAPGSAAAVRTATDPGRRDHRRRAAPGNRLHVAHGRHGGHYVRVPLTGWRVDLDTAGGHRVPASSDHQGRVADRRARWHPHPRGNGCQFGVRRRHLRAFPGRDAVAASPVGRPCRTRLLVRGHDQRHPGGRTRRPDDPERDLDDHRCREDLAIPSHPEVAPARPTRRSRPLTRAARGAR